jgi:hypothetical protein
MTGIRKTANSVNFVKFDNFQGAICGLALTGSFAHSLAA